MNREEETKQLCLLKQNYKANMYVCVCVFAKQIKYFCLKEQKNIHLKLELDKYETFLDIYPVFLYTEKKNIENMARHLFILFR